MKKSTVSDFKVGLFVFLAIAIFLFTLFWAKGISVGLSQKDYVVYFDKVSGLNNGDPVSVNGVRKGEIESIELEGDSVRISFAIDKNIKLRNDYRVYVMATELTGGKVLYVEPGIGNGEVPEGMALTGEPTSDFGSIMKSVDDITSEVKSLLTEFKKSNEQIGTVLTNVNDIVGNEGLKQNISVTVGNLNTASTNLNSLINESRSGIGGLTTKAGNTMTNIDNAINMNSQNLDTTITEIRYLASTVDSLVYNLNSIVTDIRSNNSTANKLIYDDEFYANMNKTLTEIEKLTKNIRKNGIKLNLF